MVQEPAAKGRRSFTYRGTDTMGSPTFENEGLQLIRSTYYTCNFISISQNKNRVPRILLSSAKTLHVECPGLILHRTFNVDSLPDSKQKAPVWQTHRGTRNPKSITPASSDSVNSPSNLSPQETSILPANMPFPASWAAQKGDARGCMFSWRKTIQAKILVNLQNLVNYTDSPSRIQGI